MFRFIEPGQGIILMLRYAQGAQKNEPESKRKRRKETKSEHVLGDIRKKNALGAPKETKEEQKWGIVRNGKELTLIRHTIYHEVLGCVLSIIVDSCAACARNFAWCVKRADSGLSSRWQRKHRQKKPIKYICDIVSMEMEYIFLFAGIPSGKA